MAVLLALLRNLYLVNMPLFTYKRITIFFGDAKSAFVPASFYAYDNKKMLQTAPFAGATQTTTITSLLFLYQTHSAHGICITDKQQAQEMVSFKHEGDFLITHISQLGLGVATADCLPIIIYDSYNHVVAVVHAGWKGSVNQIAVQALRTMQQNYASKLADIQVFFGPSAKACCYEVTEPFLVQLEEFSFWPQTITRIENFLFFNNVLFNRLLLQEYGIFSSAIEEQYNTCTICDLSLCSYRRTGLPARQMTIAFLR